jgi:hypothetical protein
MKSFGNDGDRDHGVQTYTVVLDGKGIAWANQLGSNYDFCRDDPSCTYEKGGRKLTVIYGKDQLGMRQMTIDFSTGGFNFSGGGLDGGFQIVGQCIKQAEASSR